MKQKTCVLFDCDGTLFDTGEGIRDCARHALDVLGATFPDEQLNSFIGPSLFYSFHNTVGLSEQEAMRGVELYRERYQKTGIDFSRPYDGIAKMLADLYADGYILTIASSKPLSMVEYLLKKYDLGKYFAFVAAAQFATVTSDKTEYVRKASLGERNVMVGDTRFDIEGAHGAGIPAIAVSYGFGARDTLAAAEYIADTPAAVYGILRKHF